MEKSFKQLRTNERTLLLIFVLVQTFIFVISYFKLPVTTYLQYSSIFLCFVFSLFFARKGILNLLVSIALFFTACADFILAFFPDYKILGLSFFCLVQIIYFIFILKQTTGIQKHINLWARIIIIALCELILWIIFKDIFNVLAGLVIFYFLNLLFNTIFSLINFKTNQFFAIGLILFVLCDIFVGFGEMSLFFDVSSSAFFNFIYSIPFNIAWTFYIPSQVLISVGNVFK